MKFEAIITENIESIDLDFVDYTNFCNLLDKFLQNIEDLNTKIDNLADKYNLKREK